MNNQYGLITTKIHPTVTTLPNPFTHGTNFGVPISQTVTNQCGPGLIPGLDAIRELSLLLVLCSARGTSVFPSP